MIRWYRRLLKRTQPFRDWALVIGRRLRTAVRIVGLVLGVLVFGLVVFGSYERAVAIAGRSEVVSTAADGTDFSAWTFDDAELAPDPDTPRQTGTVSIQLSPGAEARFVRRGRGPLLLTFSAPSHPHGASAPAHAPAHAPADRCPEGALPVGEVTVGDGAGSVLCDTARVALSVKPQELPLVISMRGAVAVGEEVRAGAGPQPLLLDGSAQLLVRHGWPFNHLCGLSGLGSLCDRFAANRFDFTAGDALGFRRGHGAADATGFVRLDPDDLAGGLRFDFAAANAALEVRRMKGDAFELSESLFERIEKSPLIQALNATVLALGLVWWFVRAPGEAKGGGERGHPHVLALLALGLAVTTPGLALADQARLQAGETGQALLRSRADRCYAVTPRHVLGGDTAASLTLPGRRLADADLLRLVPGVPEDMALLTTRAVPPELCPAFEGVQSLDGRLRGRSAAYVRLIRPDGSFDRVPLVVQSVDIASFEVRPQDPAAELVQGMSGGTVMVDDQPAGLLTDVSDAGHLGRVARLDRVFEYLAPYLGSAPALPVPAPAATTSNGVALDVVSWSAEPSAAANRADTLLRDGGAPWRTRAASAAIVLRVDPARPVLTGVLLDAGGLPDPPRTVEVLFGPGERGPWRSVATFALEPGDGTRRTSLPPTRASYVQIRATGFQHEQSAMELVQFRLLK